MITLALPHCFSDGKKVFVPKVQRYQFTDDQINRLKFDPVNPSIAVHQELGHFTDTWGPNAFEHMTRAYCWVFDARVNCWHISYPNDIETIWVFPISLGTHPGLTVVAPWIMAKQGYPQRRSSYDHMVWRIQAKQ